VALAHIATVTNWGAAFAIAGDLLDKGELTAAGTTPKSGFNNPGLVAMHLNERGNLQAALIQMESAAWHLYGAATDIELWHGRLDYIHPSEDEPVKGWVLWMVYPDLPKKP